MTNAYADSGIIIKAFILESNSNEALDILEETGEPLMISHFHQIEIPNAIRLKRFRGEINQQQERSALRAYLGDLDAGRLQRFSYDLNNVFHRAETLSKKFSPTLGTRSLDLLHVAAALEARCTTFASFDRRQQNCAKQAGLKVIPANL